MTYLQKECFILDLDGTVYLGDFPVQGTVDFITQHWDKLHFYFLSNNTSKGPDSYIKKLHRMGINVTADHFLSPTVPLVAYLRKNGITRVYLVGNGEYAATLTSAMPELELTHENAEAVILAYDTELTYKKLVQSSWLLQNPEVQYLATHPDLVCPDPKGPLPDVGSFIALYEKAAGRLPQHIFGKPDISVLAPLFTLFAQEKMVMVGDRLVTDKKLADNAGIDFILVLSGEATREDLVHEARQPWHIVQHLGELQE